MSVDPDDMQRLTKLYREIQADEQRLKGDSIEFETLVREIANRLRISEEEVCEMMATSHG